jgi:hypothetical protein
MAVASGGVVLGIAGALTVSRVVEGLLYEVEAHDAATLAFTGALFLAVAAAASLRRHCGPRA